ncbi:PREDICTED: protein TSSC4 [Cyprinodon variegatus]|uniref:U5 small nuclear ribonucleoprotein TSSC4 n=1 Tax=Cyprinodon variegatus TaxID=28743 RepID=A0A3Q2DWW3_CYPVA|nr:PREDICTED: protein TSSC4 [Cyprinodon variegatus]XP_015255893.1 PREDICTED: protein TSSC4 [Cyprinodon variegatus]XP_015255895.1 PREDICTED: protein TSSC4 [Cyprinodon variegatus]
MSDRSSRDPEDPSYSNDVLELSASDESEPEEAPGDAPFDPELDASDDDEEGKDSAAPAVQSAFILSGGGSAFSYRSRSIFDCLDSVEKSSKSSLNPAESRKTSHPASTSPVPVKKRGVPDYLVHPERWTRYSLEDVAESSDQENRKAAQQFLSGLQQETKADPPCDIRGRLIFSRPKRLPKEQTAEQASSELQGKEKELQLSHLAEEEEDDEGRERAEGGEQSRGKTRPGEKNKEETTAGPEAPQEEKIEEPSVTFTSFRKPKAKNYRRSSEESKD